MGYVIAYFFLSQIILASSAFAYLDPGSGSYILQVLIGFALAGIYALKHYWAKIRNLFTKKKQ